MTSRRAFIKLAGASALLPTVAASVVAPQVVMGRPAQFMPGWEAASEKILAGFQLPPVQCIDLFGKPFTIYPKARDMEDLARAVFQEGSAQKELKEAP